MARKQTTSVSLRIDPGDYEQIRQLAGRRGSTVADLLRDMSRSIIEQEGEIEVRGHSWSALRTVWPRLDANDRYIVARTAKGLAALHGDQDGEDE